MKTPPDCAFIGTAEGVNLRSLPVSYSPFAPCAVISRHRTAPLHLYTLALWGILILAVHKLLTGTLSRLEGGTESLPLPLPRLAHCHGLGAVPVQSYHENMCQVWLCAQVLFPAVQPFPHGHHRRFLPSGNAARDWASSTSRRRCASD